MNHSRTRAWVDSMAMEAKRYELELIYIHYHLKLMYGLFNPLLYAVQLNPLQFKNF